MTVHNITRVQCRCYIDYFQFQYNTQQVVKKTLAETVFSRSQTPVTITWVSIYAYGYYIIYDQLTDGLVSFGYFKLQY